MARIWVQRTVGLSVDLVARRLPPALAAGRATLDVRTPEGVSRDGTHRYDASWRDAHGSGTATVELCRLSSGVTQVDLGLEGRAAPRTADDLVDAVCRALDPSRPLPAPRPPRRGRIAATTAAAVVLVGAVVASQLLAPPPAVELDDAVAAYRAQELSSAAPPTSAPSPAGAAAQRDTAAKPDTQRRARRVASADAAESGTSARPATGTAPAARRRDSAPASTRQTAGAASSQPSGGGRDGGSQAERELQPGVYTYDTAGYEEIDRPSSRHTYPSRTTITVRPTDCGFVNRWQPFEQRWDEMELCPRDGGALLRRMSTNREFYGQRQRSDYVCERGSVAWVAKPGATWRARCSDGDTTIDVEGTASGWESVAVDGRKVRTLRFVIDARLSGTNTGRLRIERWVDAETGLLVRYEGRTEVTSQTGVGTVNYREELSLRLQSTTPRT